MQVENVFILDMSLMSPFLKHCPVRHKEVFIFFFLVLLKKREKKEKKGFFGKHHLSKRVVLLTDAIVTL